MSLAILLASMVAEPFSGLAYRPPYHTSPGSASSQGCASTPIGSFLGGVTGCKMNGIISRKIYMHLKDIEIHWHVVGLHYR